METQALLTLAQLLKQPQIATDSTTSTSNKLPDERENNSTIFGLRSEDRYRVLKLIEELVDAQEMSDKLRQKLEEEKTEFREKRSTLIKKIDLLSEKHEKALSNIQRLKEKHSHSLQMLEDKISTVSQKFEASLMEVKELRKVNAELKEENLALRNLNCKYVERVSEMQDVNSRLSFLVDENKNIEKTVRRQLQNLASGMNVNLDNKRDSLVGSNIYLHSKLAKDSYYDHSLHGAGDFINCRRQSSSDGFNTIKAPIHTNLDAVPQSSIIIPTTVSVPIPVSATQNISDSTATYGNSELADMTILENLFFRF